MSNCLHCGKPSDAAMCQACIDDYNGRARYVCKQCGTPASNDAPCGVCGGKTETRTERHRRQWASDGRVGLGVTLWQMSREDWLDAEEGDE